MGKVHWEQHAKKPPPIKEYDLEEVNLRMVVRERDQRMKINGRRPRTSERFVATLRYIKPPRKGQIVKAFAYGPDPERAEIAVLFAIQEKLRA